MDNIIINNEYQENMDYLKKYLKYKVLYNSIKDNTDSDFTGGKKSTGNGNTYQYDLSEDDEDEEVFKFRLENQPKLVNKKEFKKILLLLSNHKQYSIDTQNMNNDKSIKKKLQKSKTSKNDPTNIHFKGKILIPLNKRSSVNARSYPPRQFFTGYDKFGKPKIYTDNQGEDNECSIL